MFFRLKNNMIFIIFLLLKVYALHPNILNLLGKIILIHYYIENIFILLFFISLNSTLYDP